MAKQVPNELITTKEQSTDNQFLQIEPLIRTIRGQQVLLDSDLAILYGVETRQLNQQVKRNIERFPEDFMFQLTQEEVTCSRSQIATLNERTNLRSQIVTSSQEVSLKSQIVTSNHGDIAIFLMPSPKTELLCYSSPQQHPHRCCYFLLFE